MAIGRYLTRALERRADRRSTRVRAPARVLPMPPWLILLAVAIAARATTFGNPIVHADEEFYYVMAHAIARGALPYVDLWDRKPVGLFLIYLPAGIFDPPVGIWLYQALACAAVLATAALIRRLAEDAGWQRGALVAAVLYILSLNLADGQGGQAPVFYNLPIAAAALLTLRSGDHAPARRRRFGIAALGLVGVALQIKYTVVFEGVTFGLVLLRDEWRQSRSVPSLAGYAALLVSIALLPTAAVGLTYAALGHFGEFWYANVASILARKPDSEATALGHLALGCAILSPLVVLAAIGGGARPADTAHARRITFLRVWLGAALLGYLAFGSWFNHYALPVMLPAACCAAGFVHARRSGRAIAIVLVVALFVVGQRIVCAERSNRGAPAQVEAVVRAVGRGAGGLYVYQGPTTLYLATGRPALTRYIFPTHLMFEREQGAIGVDQAREIERIFDQRPEIVVVQSPERGENLSNRAIVERRLATDGYRRYVRLPLGKKWLDLFRRSRS